MPAIKVRSGPLWRAKEPLQLTSTSLSALGGEWLYRFSDCRMDTFATRGGQVFNTHVLEVKLLPYPKNCLTGFHAGFRGHNQTFSLQEPAECLRKDARQCTVHRRQYDVVYVGKKLQLALRVPWEAPRVPLEKFMQEEAQCFMCNRCCVVLAGRGRPVVTAWQSEVVAKFLGHYN